MNRITTIVLACAAVMACNRTKPQALASSADSLAPTPVGDTGHATAQVETVFVTQVPRPAPRPAPRPLPRPAPPPPAAAPPQAGAAPAPLPPERSRALLESGTEIRTVLSDSIHSRYNRVGDLVRATVANDVTSGGRVVIPAGSVVTFAINAIAPAGSRGQKGTLDIAAQGVEIRGRSYPIEGVGTDYDFEMKARSVNAGDVATAAGGAAIGAILGHVIGGKTGTIVGAVGGGAAGAAVAAKNADRDIIVHAGTPLTLQLLADFER